MPPSEPASPADTPGVDTDVHPGASEPGPELEGGPVLSDGGPVRSGASPTFVTVRERHGLIGPFSGRQLLTALAVVVAVGVGLVVITRPIAPAPPAGAVGANPAPTQFIVGSVTEGLHVGDQAPELSLRASDGSTHPLTDLNGNPIRLADLRGHPVWLDFWATWCPPCQDELPVLRDLQRSYRDRGLVIVAVSVQETNTADVAAYAKRYQLDYTIGTDLTGAIFRLYRIYGLPTQFFIDEHGVIRTVVQGPVDYNSAVANLEKIVPAPSAATPAASAVPAASPSTGPSPS